jgi:DNA mismatch endonuclease (patch repair protein)
MADRLTKERRSENMRSIRSKGMKPELQVRSLIHNMGYRFRLHARELPGKPDIVRRKQRQVIFVHGCFWHLHPSGACVDARLPKSNTKYWHAKLRNNVSRDKASVAKLRKAGWRVMIVWECEIKEPAKLIDRLRRFLGN